MKKKLLIVVFAAAVAFAFLQIARHAQTYPVSPLPLGKGIGSSIYIVSMEPYHPYLEQQGDHWYYLFQAPLKDEAFDAAVEMIIFKSGTHMNSLYQVESFRADPAFPGASVLSPKKALLWKSNDRTQRKVNALASKTSEEHPLYFVWCGGNLYGVIDENAYLLHRGKEGKKFLLSLPEFHDPGYATCIKTLGPITEDDYYEAPPTPS